MVMNSAKASIGANEMTDQQNQEQQKPKPAPVTLDQHASQPADTGKHTGRKWGVGILILLGVFLLTLANMTFWAAFTLLNTNGWVAAVGPLTKDPTVSGMISQYAVSGLFEGTDIEATAKEALPPELQPLTGPLMVGLERVADQAVNALIMSDGFNNVWVALNRTGHTAVMDVLKGEGDHLYFQDGNLTIDFNDVYNYVEDRLGVSDLNLVPQAEEGRLVLFSSPQVAVLQEVVSYLNAFGWLLPLLTIVFFVVAVWVSLWRRQTTMWIGIGMTIAMLISLIFFSVTRSSALTSVQNPVLRELGRAIIDVLTHGLMVQTLFLMIVGVLLIIGAWQAAPDSALMKWEAARKEKEAAQATTETTSS
jgi:hypothetical protein